MLDRVGSGINRHLNADWSESVDGNFQMLSVRLIHNSRHFRLRNPILGGHLDEIDVVENILAYCAARCLRSLDQQKFLLHDRRSKSGVEILDIGTGRYQFSPRGENSRSANAAGIDRVA